MEPSRFSRRSTRARCDSSRVSLELTSASRGRELLAELVEPTGLVVEMSGGLAVRLVSAELRLAAIQLGLAGGELALLRCDLGRACRNLTLDLARTRACLVEPLEIRSEPVGLGAQLGLAGLERLLARGDRGARLEQLSLSRRDGADALAELVLLLPQSGLARLEHRLAGLDPGRQLGLAPLELGLEPLERALALRDRGLLLRQLRAGSGALSLDHLELAELGRDLLLALRGARLGGAELASEIGQALLLGRGRLRPLGQLLLALFELGLERCHPRRSRIDLGRADRGALAARCLELHRFLQASDLVVKLLLAGECGGELGPQGLELDVVLSDEERLRLLGPAGDGAGAAGTSSTGARCASPPSASSSRRRSSCARSPVPKPFSVSCSVVAIRRLP